MNGKVFTCIKFRSMHVIDDGFTTNVEEDDRVTKLGSFIRRHHFDELPQLVNVLLGDMSIIGPRPHMIIDNEKFQFLVQNYHERHKVKPGITGLAQVLGYVGPVKDIENIRQRVEKDIYYVQNWSLALDIKIACWTILRMAQGKRRST